MTLPTHFPEPPPETVPFVRVLRAPNRRERDHFKILARRLEHLIRRFAIPDLNASSRAWTRAEIKATAFVLEQLSVKPEHLDLCRRARLPVTDKRPPEETT